MALRHTLFALLLANILLLSTPARAEAKWYSIWAETFDNKHKYENVPAGDPRTNAELEAMLRADAEKNMVFPVQSKHIGDKGSSYFWIAFIDSDKIAKKYVGREAVNHITDINAVEIPSPPKPPKRRDIPRRYMKRDVTSQKDAPRQLKFLSDSKKSDLDKITDYRFDKSAGHGVRVYLVDTGLNLKAKMDKEKDNEWSSAGGRKEPKFLFAGFSSDEQKRDLDEKNGHGTCMADLAVGRVNGVAKEADLTMVQIDDTTQFKKKAYLEAQVEAIVKIYDDTIDEKLKGKAVVNWSNGFVLPNDDEPRAQAFGSAFLDVFDRLIHDGVSLVTSIPNRSMCLDNVFPCAFGNPENFEFPSLITVAAGVISDGSSAFGLDNVDSWVTVHGPGDDRKGGQPKNPGLVCVAGVGEGRSSVSQTGTSHASAMVTGLMAYFRGLGLNDEEARKRLLEKAYPRKDGGPKMIYNGVN